MDLKSVLVQKWRMLKEGEVIEEGDEYLDAFTGLWTPRTNLIGQGLFKRAAPTRRRVTPDLSELSNHINEMLKHE